MKALLADTGPLYALVDPDDQYHSRAYSDWERLSREGFQLTISWSTVLETHSLISRRLGFRTAQSWLDQATESLGLLNPRREHYQEAAQCIKRYLDQDISLFDGVLATLSLQLRIPVWAFDHHFDTMRVQVWR
jgi:predicted nucleic acid-binding protein